MQQIVFYIVQFQLVALLALLLLLKIADFSKVLPRQPIISYTHSLIQLI